MRLTLGGAEAVSEKIAAPEETEALRAACAGAEAVCASVTREQKKEAPPQALRPDHPSSGRPTASSAYTAKQTLDYAQSSMRKAADLSPDGQPVFDRRHGGDRFGGPPPGGPRYRPLTGAGSSSRMCPLLVMTRRCRPPRHYPHAGAGEGGPVRTAVGERNILLLVCRELLCAVAEPYGVRGGDGDLYLRRADLHRQGAAHPLRGLA